MAEVCRRYTLECNNCGSSWESKTKVEVCPFCSTNLSVIKSVKTIETALKIICEHHGNEVLAEEKRLLAYLSDYAPELTKERKLIKIAVESGAYKALYLAKACEKQIIFSKYVSILENEYFINEIWAKLVLQWCLDVMSPDIIHSGGKVSFSINATPNRQQIHNLSTSSPAYEANLANLIEDRQVLTTITQESKYLDIKDGVLVNYTGKETEVEIPNGVIRIARYAFFNNKTIEKIVVPASVKIIESYAFSGCSALCRVVINNGVREIEGGVFRNCTSLASVALPDSVTTIGSYVFQGCNCLESVKLPNTLIEIPVFTFGNCSRLKTVKLPISVQKVSENAFDGCLHLKQIFISENANIHENAFGIARKKISFLKAPKVCFYE